MALSAPSATALEGSARHGHQFVGRPFLADVEDGRLDCGPPWPVKLVHSPVDGRATVDLRAYRGRNPALSIHHELEMGGGSRINPWTVVCQSSRAATVR
jgi:hypothetical protein